MFHITQKEYFNDVCNQYDSDYILHPKPHVKLETERLLNTMGQTKEVVDFGAGTGRLAIPLLQKGYKVTAVDLSGNSLKNLRETASQIGRRDSLTTLSTLHNCKTKMIMGMDVLHHISLNQFLPLFYQALENGGAVSFSEPNPLHIPWLFFITFSADWKIEYRIFFCNYFYLSWKLRKFGFREIRITGLGLFPLPLFNAFPSLQKFNIYLGNLPVLKLFSYRYLISAKK